MLFRMGGGAGSFAFFAGTNIAEKLPGINSQLVPVIEMKFDRLLAHAFRGGRFDGGLEHRQGACSQFRRLSRLPAALSTFVIAEGAGTGIA